MNIQDYSGKMTIKEFLEQGYRFELGDKTKNSRGFVRRLISVDDVFEWNEPDDEVDSVVAVIKSAQLDSIIKQANAGTSSGVAGEADMPVKGDEWNGKGLPPVGAECEFNCTNPGDFSYFAEHHGSLMDCVAHIDEELAVLVSKNRGFSVTCNDAWIKKPETPEQKEDRERMERIKQMYIAAGGDEGELNTEMADNDKLDVCEYLHDAGYRKQ